MKYISVLIAFVFLLLLTPIAIAQVKDGETREFEGVYLGAMQYSEVSFYNAEQDLWLGGLLFVPEGEGPFPALVVIHGNGSSHRDNPWYLTFVQSMQEQGIVVLLPDKRGSEKSEGSWRAASFDDLATDTLAAVSFLKEQQQQMKIAISQIGIVGMSQGGHFSPLVANQSPDIAFVVSVVGAGVTLHEQLIYEENHNLRELGLLPGVSNLVAYPSAWYIREVRQKQFWQAVGNYDPLPDWQAVTVPALVVYGEEDTNVPARESAARLHALDKDNLDVRIFAGSGHKVEDPAGQGNRYFRQDALQEIASFIHAAVNPSD